MVSLSSLSHRFLQSHHLLNNITPRVIIMHCTLITQPTLTPFCPNEEDPWLTRNTRSWLFMMHRIRSRAPGEIPLSEVVVVRKKRAFWKTSWNSMDVRNLVIVVGVHLLSLSAPFYFNWAAFQLFLWLLVTCGLCITLSYHRNISHRSFDLPIWLEYIFAYGGVLAIQGDSIEWVSNHRYHHTHCETERDPHSPTQGFWFSHMTWIFDTGSILKKIWPNCISDEEIFQEFLFRKLNEENKALFDS